MDENEDHFGDIKINVTKVIAFESNPNSLIKQNKLILEQKRSEEGWLLILNKNGKKENKHNIHNKKIAIDIFKKYMNKYELEVGDNYKKDAKELGII